MSIHRSVIWTLVVGAALAGIAPEAEARRGRGGRDRVRERIPLVEVAGAPFQARQARLRLERRGDRQELRVQIQGAPTGLSLDVWMENGTGGYAEVGSMREDRGGEYVWRLRTKKGDPLPFGVADLSELSGRKVEVRTASGETVLTAAIPTISAATARSAGKRPLRSGLVIDETVAGSIGASGAKAKVVVRRKKNGDEKFEVELDDAPAGLSLVLWMEGSSGAMVEVGPMTEEAGDGDDDRSFRDDDVEDDDDSDSGSDDDGSDDDSDSDSDDGSDDDDSGSDDDGSDGDDDGDEDGDDDEFEYSYEVDTGDGETLPVGATSVSDLAGLTVEIRTSDGVVLASGTVPALAEDDDDDGDDHEGDDDCDDDDVEGDDDGSDDDGDESEDD